MMFEKQILKEFQYIIIYKTILHSGCESGNAEVVKYILLLHTIDVNEKYKDIIFHFNSIQNQIF